MSFDWQHLLWLAEELNRSTSNQAGRQEALYRSAINRAYYAAYNYARAFATSTARGHDRFQHKEGEPGHSALRIWFQHKYRRDRKRETAYLISATLLSMYGKRETADYEANSADNFRATASDAIAEAQNVIRLVNELRP